MASKLKWLLFICLFLAAVCAGAYGTLLWEQGKIFDRESASRTFEVDGVEYAFNTVVNKKSLFGRQFTVNQTIQNAPFVTYKGTVNFGFDPKVVLRIHGIPSIPAFEQALLNSSTVITGHFNVRFLPERITLRSEATTIEVPGGGEIQFGDVNLVSKVTYSTPIYEKEQVLDRIDFSFISDNYSDPTVKLGPIELTALYTPKTSRFLTMDLSLRDSAVEAGDFKISSLSVKSDFEKKDGDVIDTFLIDVKGSEKFDSPISVKADVGITCPDSINLDGILAKALLNRGLPNSNLEKEISELVKALRGGLASIVVNNASYSSKVFTFDGKGLIGAPQDKPGQWAKFDVSLTTDRPEQLLFFTALMPKNSINQETNGISTELLIKEVGKNVAVYCNGKKLYEGRIDPVLKMLN